MSYKEGYIFAKAGEKFGEQVLGDPITWLKNKFGDTLITINSEGNQVFVGDENVGFLSEMKGFTS